MEGHLGKSCKVIEDAHLTATYKAAGELLERFRSMMDDGEFAYLDSRIKTRQVPTPRLLIKDHKPRQSDGHYKTRLLVPATNFTQGFAKIGYKAIKVIFDSNKVKYCTRTITQASHLKIQLEGLPLTSGNATIASQRTSTRRRRRRSMQP